MKPIIAITASCERKPNSVVTMINTAYSRSVSLAGGLPFILPWNGDPKDAESYLDRVDGILFSGGADVSPLRYGESPSSKVPGTQSERDAFEMALIAEASGRGLPILGICRGHQIVNAALGGSLYQDLYEDFPGARGHSPSEIALDEPFHRVEILSEDSALFAALGGRIVETNSFHHQAVKKLAPGLVQTARSEEGVLEGYESPGCKAGSTEHFIMGVQFHPECMTLRFPVFVGIFRLHVEAAARYAKRFR